MLCYRLQQEAQEREMDEKIAAASKEKELRERQLEQEQRIARVRETFTGIPSCKLDPNVLLSLNCRYCFIVCHLM